MKEINPQEDSEEVTIHFELERGMQRTIQVVNEQGEPVWGSLVAGLGPRASYFPKKHWLPQMQVVGLRRAEKRRVLIQHPESKLAAVATVLADGAQTVLLLTRANAGGNVKTTVLGSTDLGESFQVLWMSFFSWDTDMWVPQVGALAGQKVYMLHRGRLRVSDDGGDNFVEQSIIDVNATSEVGRASCRERV